MRIQRLGARASGRCGAARVGGSALLLCVAVVLACAPRTRPDDAPAEGAAVHTAEAPSSAERYCAWYGSPQAGTLYFGQAAFWSAMRAAGDDPKADLREPGPQRVGRFDLEREVLLEPLDVGAPGRRSGVWDVLPRGDRLWFTTFYEPAGVVTLATGAVHHLPELGGGLNEIAPGPGDTVLISRYSSADGGLVAIGPDGSVAERWPLVPPPGYTVAPKTPAWDASRRESWVTSDLLPGTGSSSAGARFDAYHLDDRGRELKRIETPEIQFAAFGPDGTGWLVEASGPALHLRIVPTPESGRAERRVLLDAAFVHTLDFAQDVQPTDDGRAVVTRWSGRVHVVDREGEVRTAQLPKLDPEGLYYTAVLHGDRLCATYCADVTVVCIDAP